MPSDPQPPHLAAETILSLDNIPLDLPVAGLGSRALAAGLDYLVLVAGQFLLIVGVLALGVLALELHWGWNLAAVLFVVFGTHWGYFAISEMFWGGRTLGKAAVGLRVVGRSGGSPSKLSIGLRNALRDIDLLCGALLMATDDLSRRFGDRLAGTLVVHDRPPMRELTLGRVPAGWGAREVALVEAYLRRAAELEAARSRVVGHRLLELVRRGAPEWAGDIGATVERPDLALRYVLRVVEV